MPSSYEETRNHQPHQERSLTVNENYFYIIHWPSQRKVFQGDWETATGFLDNFNKKIAPGPALIENPDFALQPAHDNRKGKRGR
jgi:hypothetical protein